MSTADWYKNQHNKLVKYIETERKKILDSEKNRANVFKSKVSGFEKRIKKESTRVDNIIQRYKFDMKRFGASVKNIPSIKDMAENIRKHELMHELRKENARLSKDPELFNPIKSVNRKDLKDGTLTLARAQVLLKEVKRPRSKKK